MNETINVLLVDDHAIIRNGINNMLLNEPDIRVVGEAENGKLAIEKALELQPDVILMDLNMPECNGLEATAVISQKLPEVKIVLLTISDSGEDVFEALRMGAQGYILKTADKPEIVQAIRKVAIGEAVISPKMATKLAGELKGLPTKQFELSKREAEVLELAAQGLIDRQIAAKLEIGETTVGTYIHRVLEKLHVKNRAEAIAMVSRNESRRK